MRQPFVVFLIALALGAVTSTAAANDYVLAISWQPAFCETRPKVRECRSQTGTRRDADHFALHGLWPQPRGRVYCDVPQAEIDRDKSGRWRQLSMPALSDELRARLDEAMPGSQSALDRHEWVKHGTCMEEATPETYYAASVALLDAVNASAVRDLFASRIGEELSGKEIRAAFEQAFGAGTGKRIRLACKRDGRRRLIHEITIGLSGTVDESPDMAALIAAAPPTDPGCPGGIVDPVGLQ